MTYHHYPPQSTGDFSQWMADENAVLASKSSAYVTGYLAPLNPPGTKFLISEFLPSNDGLGTGTSVTDGTLYGAIYAAEYVMRMSAVPSMLYVGMHALTGTRGVNAANSHYIDVQNAYNQGTTIDTLTLNFGYYTDGAAAGPGGPQRRSAERDAGRLDGRDRRRHRARYGPRSDSSALRAGVHQRHRPAQRGDREQERDGATR